MEKLGKYEITQRLAIGGMAEVYLAMDTGPQGFRRRVVLKRILPQFANDRSFVEMFLTEARLAGQLTHPNIAQVYEVGEAEGSYFIAMEYVDGPDLLALSRLARDRKQPMPYYLAAKVVSFACEGLGYAHALTDPETGERLNVIHRDISPDNIILTMTGAVKVVDFGIAKAASQVHKTGIGVLKGKLSYMPPEQMRRESLDHRADIYSLGVVLYQLLTGTRPYEDLSEVELIHAVGTGEPGTPLEQHRPDLPAELVTIVSRAMAQDVSNRYPDCEAFQAELERFVHRSPEPVGTPQIARLIVDLGGQSKVRHSGLKTPPLSASKGLATPLPRAAPSVATPTSAPPPPSEPTVNAGLAGLPRAQESISHTQLVHIPPGGVGRRVAIGVGIVVMLIIAGRALMVPLFSSPPAAGPALAPEAAEVAAAPRAALPSTPPAPPVEVPPVPAPDPPKVALPPPGRVAPGTLVVDVQPYATVYINGKRRREVQGIERFKLPPGRHRVELVHAKGKRSFPSIQVVSGKEVRITERF